MISKIVSSFFGSLGVNISVNMYFIPSIVFNVVIVCIFLLVYNMIIYILLGFVNVLYTSVTRAIRVMVMVREKSAVSYAIKNISSNHRNTRLSERMRQALSGKNL